METEVVRKRSVGESCILYVALTRAHRTKLLLLTVVEKMSSYSQSNYLSIYRNKYTKCTNVLTPVFPLCKMYKKTHNI
jgi:hypothetical protein